MMIDVLRRINFPEVRKFLTELLTVAMYWPMLLKES